MVDLGKVVVFRGEPEYGGVGMSAAEAWRARARAVAALNGVNSGPPNSPPVAR